MERQRTRIHGRGSGRPGDSRAFARTVQAHHITTLRERQGETRRGARVLERCVSPRRRRRPPGLETILSRGG